MKAEEVTQMLKDNIKLGTGLVVGIGSKICHERKPRIDGDPKCIGCVSEAGCKLLCDCMLVYSKGVLCGMNTVFTMLEVMDVIRKQQDKMANSEMAKKLNAIIQEGR